MTSPYTSMAEPMPEPQPLDKTEAAIYKILAPVGKNIINLVFLNDPRNSIAKQALLNATDNMVAHLVREDSRSNAQKTRPYETSQYNLIRKNRDALKRVADDHARAG